jgi:hypothetical protein
VAVLISFFDSKQAALDGLASFDGIGRDESGRSGAVVVSRDRAGTRSRVEPPAPPPLRPVVGTCLGGFLGSWAGEAGLVVGLFFGLYVGLLVDAWRILARGDLLDEIQDGLAPAQAALVSFGPDRSAAPREGRLAALGAVTVHRFPRRPIEEDMAREAAEAVAEVDRLMRVEGDASQGGESEEARRTAAVRRLRTIESIADQLLERERAQFETDVHILRRQLDGAPSCRAARIKRRISKVRASHERSRKALETSRGHVRAAAALVG